MAQQPQRLNLTRDQLAAFLPDHQAVKAFENLFLDVNENIPSNNDEILALIGSGQQPRSDNLRRNVAELDQQQPQRQNLTQIEKRLAAIEAFLGI